MPNDLGLALEIVAAHIGDDLALSWGDALAATGPAGLVAQPIRFERSDRTRSLLICVRSRRTALEPEIETVIVIEPVDLDLEIDRIELDSEHDVDTDDGRRDDATTILDADGRKPAFYRRAAYVETSAAAPPARAP